MTLERLVENYGYVALFIGTFLEGETILVLAAFMAHRGYLHLEWVMFWGGLGSLAGDQLFYFIGRIKGQPYIEKHAKWRGRAARVRRLLARYPRLIIIGFRYLYGIRNVTPFVIGAAGFPPRQFVPLNVIGAAVWAVSVRLAAYFFGHALEVLLSDLRRYEWTVLAVLSILGVAIWWLRRVRTPPAPEEPDDGGGKAG